MYLKLLFSPLRAGKGINGYREDQLDLLSAINERVKIGNREMRLSRLGTTDLDLYLRSYPLQGLQQKIFLATLNEKVVVFTQILTNLQQLFRLPCQLHDLPLKQQSGLRERSRKVSL